MNEQGASVVSFTHEQNNICSHKLSHKQLNDIALEHTIICRQLFAGHVVGSRPMKRKKHLHRMINCIMSREKVFKLFFFFQLFCRTLSRRYSKRNDDGETN